MRRLLFPFLAASLFTVSTCAFGSVRTHRHSTSHPIVRRSATRTDRTVRSVEHSSYSGMSGERATEIQTALIQRGYLTGEPTGSWDSASVAAMQKMQSDNGWQTKFVPDSRALIKLGLGGASNAPASTASTATASALSDASVLAAAQVNP